MRSKLETGSIKTKTNSELAGTNVDLSNISIPKNLCNKQQQKTILLLK